MKNKKNLLILGLGLIVILLVALLVNRVYTKYFKLTTLEKLYITKLVDDNTDYAFALNDNKLDNYVVYTMYKNYNETGNTNMSFKDIASYINDNFKTKTKASEIEKLGITATLIDNYITTDQVNKGFVLTIPEETYRSVALKKVNKYVIDDIKKNGNKYLITYIKYEVTNPYEILNYYNDQKEIDDEMISIINEYLKGDMFYGKFVTYIDAKTVKEVGKKSDEVVTITYELTSDTLLIK